MADFFPPTARFLFSLGTWSATHGTAGRSRGRLDRRSFPRVPLGFPAWPCTHTSGLNHPSTYGAGLHLQTSSDPPICVYCSKSHFYHYVRIMVLLALGAVFSCSDVNGAHFYIKRALLCN